MLSAVIATVFMGLQKYVSAPALTEGDKNQYPGIVAWCDLVDGNENPWTVGQLTTLILAFAPFYSFTTDISNETQGGEVVRGDESNMMEMGIIH